MTISRYSDDDGNRHYCDGDVDVLSVTSVLNGLDVDETGLDIWKERNDGQGDNPHWMALFWWKARRGTLCHYSALSSLDDSLEWSDEERDSLNGVVHGPQDSEWIERFESEGASTEIDDIVYSVLVDKDVIETREEYKDVETTLTEICLDDQKWFTETFNTVYSKIGVQDVIAVEAYLLDDERGYGGQVDLVYKDVDDNVVVADLKTSSSLREKHILQGLAYTKAVESDEDIEIDEVDRTEVWQIHPDSRTWNVYSHDEYKDFYNTKLWWSDHWGNYNYQTLEEQWDEFMNLL